MSIKSWFLYLLDKLVKGSLFLFIFYPMLILTFQLRFLFHVLSEKMFLEECKIVELERCRVTYLHSINSVSTSRVLFIDSNCNFMCKKFSRVSKNLLLHTLILFSNQYEMKLNRKFVQITFSMFIIKL